MAQGGDISLPDVSKLNDLKDDQIEALIAKLAEVQTHAPQIIAALEAQQEARSRGSRSINSKDRSSKHSRESPPNKNHKSKGKAAAPPPQIEEEEEEDDYEDEDYDDFDEDAEYPMVGDGYSDEISVVSDMTTPTVVSSMDINEEEYYKDMVIGGMKMHAPKKKDMLSRVQQTNARKAAGAAGAASKKKAAAEVAPTSKKPSRASQKAAPGEAPATKKKASSKTKAAAAGASSPPSSGTKKVKKKVVKKSAAANGEGSSGAAPKKKAPQEQKAGPVMIDDDGFLVDQSNFTTFDSSNNPFASAPSFSAGPDNGGDGFGNFGSFDFAPAPAPAAAAKKAPSRLKRLDGSKPSKKSGSGSVPGTGAAPAKIKKKSGSRRASLGAS